MSNDDRLDDKVEQPIKDPIAALHFLASILDAEDRPKLAAAVRECAEKLMPSAEQDSGERLCARCRGGIVEMTPSHGQRREGWPADLSLLIAVSEEFRQVIKDGNVQLAAGTAAKIATTYFPSATASVECPECNIRFDPQWKEKDAAYRGVTPSHAAPQIRWRPLSEPPNTTEVVTALLVVRDEEHSDGPLYIYGMAFWEDGKWIDEGTGHEAFADFYCLEDDLIATVEPDTPTVTRSATMCREPKYLVRCGGECPQDWLCDGIPEVQAALCEALYGNPADADPDQIGYYLGEIQRMQPEELRREWRFEDGWIEVLPLRDLALKGLAVTNSETASREAVIEEIAKHIEDAPLTYMGPDPGGIKDLKFLIVEAIRDMKGKP